MKILMLNNEYPPLGGGTGTVNAELLNQFKQFPDLKIDLLTSARGKEKEVLMISENIRVIKYPVRNKNIHHSSNIELIKYTLKAIFAAFKLHRKEKYDMSFAWSTVPAGYVSHLLRIFRKVPFIVRVGGPDIPGFEERYKNLYKVISPLIRRIWKKALLLIVKCKTEAEMIKKINDQLDIRIFYNGIDPKKFNVGRSRSNSEIITIICPARLIKRKGQDLLIKAVAELKNEGITYMVNLIGEGDEKEAFKELSEELGVSELIRFKGYVPRENILNEYQQSDLFCLPSYNEGMSNALLEAMACGLPVIVTDVGGTGELVDDSNGFIFNAGDSKALANILKDIFHNKDMLNELGNISRHKAEKLSWDKIADQYYALFKKK